MEAVFFISRTIKQRSYIQWLERIVVDMKKERNQKEEQHRSFWESYLKKEVKTCGLVAQSCPTLLWPHGLQPDRLPWPWNSPGKDTGVGCHFLLLRQMREVFYISVQIHRGVCMCVCVCTCVCVCVHRHVCVFLSLSQ